MENPPANAVKNMIEPHNPSYWQLKKKTVQTHFMAMNAEWMKEDTLYALQSRYTSSEKYDAKHMFSYLDFRCYFEANGYCVSSVCWDTQ